LSLPVDGVNSSLRSLTGKVIGHYQNITNVALRSLYEALRGLYMTVGSKQPSANGERTMIDLFFFMVVLTGWTVAMGLGAFLAWVFYEKDNDDV